MMPELRRGDRRPGTLSHTGRNGPGAWAAGVALTRCLIPAGEATTALGDLDAMGITDHELFPDLTGLADLATMRAALAVTHRVPEVP
jgi:hypothetical protein